MVGQESLMGATAGLPGSGFVSRNQPRSEAPMQYVGQAFQPACSMASMNAGWKACATVTLSLDPGTPESTVDG